MSDAKWDGEEWVCSCGTSWWRAAVAGVATVCSDEDGGVYEIMDMDVDIDGDPVCTGCQQTFSPIFEEEEE